MQCFIQALESCACKAIYGHWSSHANHGLGRHMHIKPTKIKTCMYTVGALKYDGIRKGKICDRGTSYRYLLRTENAIFILFCLRK